MNNERAQSLNIESANTSKNAQAESSFVMAKQNILDQTKNQ